MTTLQDCCTEFAQSRLSRRTLLGTAAGVAGLSVVYGGAEVRASAAASSPAPSVLVVVSMRGAADGLSLVVPHADPVYYAARPGISVAADRLLARDGMFGLHPSLAPLLPLWQSGRLAAVHATGLPAANRSHFSAMEEIEDASAGSVDPRRLAQPAHRPRRPHQPGAGRSASGAASCPPRWPAPRPRCPPRPSTSSTIPGEEDGHAARRRASLRTLWGSDRSVLGTAARDTFTAVDTLAPVVAGSSTPTGGATYPGGDLGEALAHAARIIRGDVGVQVITVDQGDWDMHTGVGTLEWGKLKDHAATFASALAAFFADIGSFGDKVTVVCLSEFGRRVAENANYGLDHGHGNVMFLAGAGVRGGRYYGTWPGLAQGADADLTVTTDYRSVLTEVVRTRFGADSSRVFPGFVGPSLGTMA